MTRLDPASEVVLVTGATSGIGAGLAGRFHARGARVIAAGRRVDRLADLARRHPGMDTVVMDVTDPGSIRAALADVTARHPHLTTLINNAGRQRLLDFSAADPPDHGEIAAEIATNLTGLVDVTAAALPALRAAPRARVVHIGSGLGFVPLAAAPVYSATKAAVHSFTVSLRRQLAGTTVQVVEIVPPVVETELHRGQAGRPRRAMPLDAFLDRAVKGLDSGRDEVAVGLARVLRTGSRIAPGRLLALVNRNARR
jgi:uncharacterized oxidoreductase